MAPKGSTSSHPALLPARATAPGSRGRLLATAVELFAARGYYGVSVRDLADAMGVKPSALYAHYSSKKELFSYLVELANDEIALRLRNALLDADSDPTSALYELVRGYVKFHTEFPQLARVGHNDLHVLTGASMHRVAQLRKVAVDLMQSVIDRGNQSGDFDCPEPWLAVAAIAGMGIRVAHWYRPTDQPVESSVDSYPAEVRQWAPHPVSVDDVSEQYAEFALKLVGARGQQ